MSTPLPAAAGRRAELLGGLIGAVAGVAFVVLNAGVLGDPLALVVRIVGVLTGVLFAGSAVRRMRAASAAGGSARGGFSRGYWWIVLAEVVALLAGVRVLDAAFDRAYLGVAWVAIVVGVHFFGLGRLWHAARLYALAAAMTGFGLVGLVLGWARDSATVAGVVAGVGSAVALFVVSWFSIARSVSP